MPCSNGHVHAGVITVIASEIIQIAHCKMRSGTLDVPDSIVSVIAFAVKKPILFLGIGQLYDDLTSFDPRFVVESIVG